MENEVLASKYNMMELTKKQIIQIHFNGTVLENASNIK